MIDLEQAINRAIEDACMRLRELPNETRDDGVELDKAGLNWAQAIYLLCQARSEVLTKPTSAYKGGKLDQAKLANELANRIAKGDSRRLANL